MILNMKRSKYIQLIYEKSFKNMESIVVYNAAT